MNMWLAAGAGLLVALIPCGITCFRGRPEDRLAALELAGVIVTLELLLLAQAFHRPAFYDLAVTLAMLSFGGGMVFARFLERWL